VLWCTNRVLRTVSGWAAEIFRDIEVPFFFGIREYVISKSSFWTAGS